MKFLRQNIEYSIFISIFTVIATIVCILLLVYPNAEAIGFPRETAETLNDGWFYYDEANNQQFVNLPAYVTMQNGVSSIYHILPQNSGNGTYLCVFSSNKNFTVTLNDAIIYQHTANHYPTFIKNSGYFYHMIKLPRDSAGKQIGILMEKRYENITKSSYKTIYFGTEAEIYHTLIAEYGLKFILSIAILIVGFVFWVIYFLFLKRASSNHVLLYLSMIAILIASWLLQESRLLQFFIQNPIWQILPTYLALILLPIPCFLLLKELIENKTNLVLTIGFYAACLNAILTLILQFTGILDLKQTLFTTHYILIFACLYTPFFLFRQYKKNKEQKKQIGFYLLAFLLLAISGLLELYFYYKTHHNTNIFLYFGILLFFLVLGIQYIHSTFGKIKQLEETQYYYNLAFTDMSTNVYNRTAYNNRIERYIPADIPNEHCIIIFDLNNLKHINDTFGHLAGDTVIQAFAICAKEQLEPSGDLYRIGGDEFAYISTNVLPHEVKDFLRLLSKTVETQTISEYSFSVSYGYEFFVPYTTKDFYDAIASADKKMYLMKESMKN
ncbi:MAG: GGDEF domain-containing protein [Velocimicrobium sp.]